MTPSLSNVGTSVTEGVCVCMSVCVHASVCLCAHYALFLTTCTALTVPPSHGRLPADPDKSHVFPEDYLQRVKAMHERGGSGSQG